MQGKVLISISNKDIFIKLKKMRGFSSKTIEILLENFFSKVSIDDLSSKYYEEGEEAYRKYVADILNRSNSKDNGNDNLEKDLAVMKQVESSKKRPAKIESSTFWQ